MQILPLNQLPIGEKGTVFSMDFSGIARRRMLDLGFVPGTEVEALQKSPSGNPIAYHVRGTVIALRAEDAGRIALRVGA